jgi:cryptochrome
VAFPKKYDPSGALVRHYCPELAKFPDKFIYEPWTAPIAEQKKAGCIIGKDYPERMLDDKERKETCLQRMKAAFDLGLKGNSKEVLDGSARKLLQQKYGGSSESRKRKRINTETGQKRMDEFVAKV